MDQQNSGLPPGLHHSGMHPVMSSGGMQLPMMQSGGMSSGGMHPVMSSGGMQPPPTMPSGGIQPPPTVPSGGMQPPPMMPMMPSGMQHPLG